MIDMSSYNEDSYRGYWLCNSVEDGELVDVDLNEPSNSTLKSKAISPAKLALMAVGGVALAIVSVAAAVFSKIAALFVGAAVGLGIAVACGVEAFIRYLDKHNDQEKRSCEVAKKQLAPQEVPKRNYFEGVDISTIPSI